MFSFDTRLFNKSQAACCACHAMQRRQGNVRFKTKAGGQQEREALLETKTHRRVNRRQVLSAVVDGCLTISSRTHHCLQIAMCSTQLYALYGKNLQNQQDDTDSNGVLICDHNHSKILNISCHCRQGKACKTSLKNMVYKTQSSCLDNLTLRKHAFRISIACQRALGHACQMLIAVKELC